MDKLYYLVCEERETTLFEGRFQGRTRGAALKFLKGSIGRKSLSGLVFTITEIPVPLIREIVAEILAEKGGASPKVVPITTAAPAPPPKPSPVKSPEPSAPAPKRKKKAAAKVGNPGHGDELWTQVRAFWEECRNFRVAAEKFNLSPNSVKTRARREGWNK